YVGNDPTNCRDPQGLVSPLFSPNHTETTYAIINLIWPSRPTIPHVIKPTLPGNSSPTVLTAGKPSTTVPWVYPTGGLYIATIPTYYGNNVAAQVHTTNIGDLESGILASIADRPSNVSDAVQTLEITGHGNPEELFLGDPAHAITQAANPDNINVLN